MTRLWRHYSRWSFNGRGLFGILLVSLVFNQVFLGSLFAEELGLAIPGKSVGNVSIGMSELELLEKMGPPIEKKLIDQKYSVLKWYSKPNFREFFAAITQNGNIVQIEYSKPNIQLGKSYFTSLDFKSFEMEFPDLVKDVFSSTESECEIWAYSSQKQGVTFVFETQDPDEVFSPPLPTYIAIWSPKSGFLIKADWIRSPSEVPTSISGPTSAPPSASPSSSSDPIDLVKRFVDKSGFSYENLLSAYSNTPNWKTLKTKDGKSIVEFGGVAKEKYCKNGKQRSLLFQFEILNPKSLKCVYLEMDQEKMPIDLVEMVISIMVIAAVQEKESEKIPDRVR